MLFRIFLTIEGNSIPILLCSFVYKCIHILHIPLKIKRWDQQKKSTNYLVTILAYTRSTYFWGHVYYFGHFSISHSIIKFILAGNIPHIYIIRLVSFLSDLYMNCLKLYHHHLVQYNLYQRGKKTQLKTKFQCFSHGL